MFDRPHVAVDLQQKVLIVVKTLSLASCPAGSTAFGRCECLDLTVAVFWESWFLPSHWIVLRQLQTDAESQTIWMSCLLEQIVERCWEIRVPISSDLNEDCVLHQRADDMRKVCAIGPTS